MARYSPIDGARQTASFSLDSISQARTQATQLRWTQAGFRGSEGTDVWALDDVQLQGTTPSSPLLELDVNIGCGDQTGPDDSLELHYSLNYGSSWTRCEPCDPLRSATCRRWSMSCQFKPSAVDDGWVRLRFRQDNAAQVRFSFRNTAPQGVGVGIDAVAITAACPTRCAGHGSCQANGTCACDAGYAMDKRTGDCVPQVGTLPSIYRATFDTELATPNQLRATGTIVPGNGTCGAVGAGPKFVAAVDSNNRMFVTGDIDTRNASFLEFHQRMGDNTITCRSPTQTSEGLSVAYSTNGGLDYN